MLFTRQSDDDANPLSWYKSYDEGVQVSHCLYIIYEKSIVLISNTGTDSNLVRNQNLLCEKVTVMSSTECEDLNKNSPLPHLNNDQRLNVTLYVRFQRIQVVEKSWITFYKRVLNTFFYQEVWRRIKIKSKIFKTFINLLELTMFFIVCLCV